LGSFFVFGASPVLINRDERVAVKIVNGVVKDKECKVEI
jgi:hypothetical protein